MKSDKVTLLFINVLLRWRPVYKIVLLPPDLPFEFEVAYPYEFEVFYKSIFTLDIKRLSAEYSNVFCCDCYCNCSLPRTLRLF